MKQNIIIILLLAVLFSCSHEEVNEYYKTKDVNADFSVSDTLAIRTNRI